MPMTTSYQERHYMRVEDLTRMLEFNSDNDGYLKEALEALNVAKYAGMSWTRTARKNGASRHF